MKKPQDLHKKTYILQYNKIKGVQQGTLEQSHWQRDCEEFHYQDQVAEKILNKTGGISL